MQVVAALLAVGLLGITAPAEAVTPSVSISISAKVIPIGGKVTISVAVRSGAPGQKVLLRQRHNGVIKTVATKYLPLSGSTKRVTFTRYPKTSRDRYLFRVQLVAKGRYSGVTSSWVQTRVKVPLRFDVTGAKALALDATANATTRPMSRATTDQTSASDLSVVTASGTTYDAATLGFTDIKRVIVAKDGFVYLVFNQKVNLEDTTGPNAWGCVLARLDPATNALSCVDSSLWYMPTLNDTRNVVQFDDLGSVYYLGYGRLNGQDTTVLRRRAPDGTKTDLINDNVEVISFLAEPDGSVLVSGVTSSTSTNWTRLISPVNSVQPLTNTWNQCGMARFPDGNTYFCDAGTMRRLVSSPTYQVDPTPWLGGSSPTNSCPEFYFCTGQSLGDSMTMSDGDVFVVSQTYTNGWGHGLLQLYPTVASAPLSSLTSVDVATTTGDYIFAAGIASAPSATGGLTNTIAALTLSGTELTAPEPGIEYYHLSPVDATTVMFDGLRFSDNSVVYGTASIVDGQVVVTVLGTMTTRWEDVQGLLG